MDGLLLFVTAMIISMIVVPLMIRVAPRIGMVDMPDQRKVHTTPIPRVGGIGIVIGSLIPIILWLPFEPVIASFIFGCLVLLVFGVWDDSCELGHYVKFIGQFLAVIPLIYYADLYVETIPFFGDLPEFIGKAFTVIAMVGMINAINHSDGLDGLAGGMSLLSLICIGYLAFLVDDFNSVFIILAVLGGVFGFLRFNSHPARVFMGDGGSQFLGFVLAYLAIMLTQKTHTALSPALPLLFLGLPIIDIIAVFYLRISGGMNWFKATRNHIHHRLLDLGFTHYESVIIIYSIQVFLIVSAVILKYEYDFLVLGLYFIVCSSVFIVITISEKNNYKVNVTNKESVIDRFFNNTIQTKLVSKVFGGYVIYAIPALFLIVSFIVETVPSDIGFLSGLLLVLMVVFYFGLNSLFNSYMKFVYYIFASLIVYLDAIYMSYLQFPVIGFEAVFYILLAISIAFVIKYDRKVEFQLTPLDYLVMVIVVGALIVFNLMPDRIDYGYSIIKLVLLFYGCELIEKRVTPVRNYMNIALFLTMSVIVYRSIAI